MTQTIYQSIKKTLPTFGHHMQSERPLLKINSLRVQAILLYSEINMLFKSKKFVK